MHRRDFLKTAFGIAGLVSFFSLIGKRGAMAEEMKVVPDSIGKIKKTDEEWKKALTSQQYDILRQEGTEHPFTSALLEEHHKGIFACVACDLPLFPSQYKFDSGTGWPSFYDTLPGHIETKTDYKLVAPRIEYHCARCGGHHGHVFNDGPPPTGLRYCSNGAVLKFIREK